MPSNGSARLWQTENCRDERRRRPVEDEKFSGGLPSPPPENFRPVRQRIRRQRRAARSIKNAGHVARAGACQGFLSAVKAARVLAVAPAAVRFHQAAFHRARFFPTARTRFQFGQSCVEIPAGNSLRQTRRSQRATGLGQPGSFLIPRQISRCSNTRPKCSRPSTRRIR